MLPQDDDDDDDSNACLSVFRSIVSLSVHTHLPVCLSRLHMSTDEAINCILIVREVDFALGPFAFNWERYHYACEFTQPIFIDYESVFMRRPRIETDLIAFLRPFRWEVRAESKEVLCVGKGKFIFVILYLCLLSKGVAMSSGRRRPHLVRVGSVPSPDTKQTRQTRGGQPQKEVAFGMGCADAGQSK